MEHPSTVVSDFGGSTSSDSNTVIRGRLTCIKQPRSFWDVLAGFADKTSCVGPGNISSSRSWHGRVMWILLFAAAWSLTIYMTHKNFMEYTSFKTRAGVYMGFSKLKFPMVSICNTNPIRRNQINNVVSSKLRDFLNRLDYSPSPHSNDSDFGWSDLFWDVNETLFNNEDYYYMYDYDVGWGSVKADPRSQVMEEFKILYGGEDSYNKAVIGHQLQDMLISCSYAGLTCNHEHFTISQSNVFGNCFTFNGESDSNLTSRRSGNQNGLSLILYLENAQYIPGLTSGYGARLAVGEPGQMVLPEYNGLYLSAGAETDVGLTLLNITRQGTPYGDCVSDSENRAYFNGLPSDKKYSRQACQATCLYSLVLKECGCFFLSQTHLYPSAVFESTTLQACEFLNKSSCVRKLSQDYSVHENVSCSCPNPCWERTYDTMLSSRDWPTNSYVNSLQETICQEPSQAEDCLDLSFSDMAEKRRNFLKVNIFYRDMNYEEIKEEPSYSDSQFYSDLGGTVGLFLGLSVLSLFELAQLIMELCEWGLEQLCGHDPKTDQQEQLQENKSQKSHNIHSVFNMDMDKMNDHREPIRYVTGQRT